MLLSVSASLSTAGCLVRAGTAPVPDHRIGPLAAGWHTTSVDGVALAYEVRGHGRVCFVHPGGPGFDASYLRLPALERERTVVYIDPLGTGKSGALPADQRYSRTRDVEAIEALRRAIGLSRVCLVGHSYGGFVALDYALAHQDHVTQLVLYSTSPTTGGDFDANARANLAWFADQPWFAQAKAAEDAEATATDEAQLRASVVGAAPLYFAKWSEAFAPTFAKVGISFPVSARRDHDAFDVRARLPELHVPVSILAGKRDWICGEAPVKWLVAGIPRAHVIVLPEAGHYAHVETPQAFDAAIVELLH